MVGLQSRVLRSYPYSCSLTSQSQLYPTSNRSALFLNMTFMPVNTQNLQEYLPPSIQRKESCEYISPYQLLQKCHTISSCSW